jgi:hypothetical protein
MTNGKVLVLGEYAPAVRERVGEIIYRAGAERVELADWKVHREQLRQPGVVAAVFPSTLPDLETLCLDVRSELSAEDLPLLVVTPCHWETGLERLFMYSVDDFVTESRLDALEAKLLALGRGNPWTNLNPESGRVVVADPDRRDWAWISPSTRPKCCAS